MQDSLPPTLLPALALKLPAQELMPLVLRWRLSPPGHPPTSTPP